MAFSMLQSNVAKSSGTSPTISFLANNKAGSLLVCAWRMPFGSSNTFTVTDTQGNSWVAFGSPVNNGSDNMSLWYAPNAKAGANMVTVHGTGSFNYSILIAEFFGTAISNVYDTSHVALATTTTPNSGNIITSSGEELLLGLATNNNADNIAITPAGGWTAAVNESQNPQLFWSTTSAPGTYAFSGTATSEPWATAIAAFRPLVPAPPTLTNRIAFISTKKATFSPSY